MGLKDAAYVQISREKYDELKKRGHTHAQICQLVEDLMVKAIESPESYTIEKPEPGRG